jgi:hypothetical protein
MIICRWTRLRVRNVSDKVAEKIKHILCLITFSRKSCSLWHVKKYGRARQAIDDNMIPRMRFACWITNATYTHWEYVILTAFPRQQWLRERASLLHYTYISSFVYLNNSTKDNAVFHFHGNAFNNICVSFHCQTSTSYANAPQCYVIRTFYLVVNVRGSASIRSVTERQRARMCKCGIRCSLFRTMSSKFEI